MACGGYLASTNLWRLAVLLSQLSLACRVDDRQLGVTANGENIGGGSSVSTTGGRNSLCQDTPDASFDGKSSNPSKSVCSTGVCPDLNDNHLADDTETLVQNPTFGEDVAGWQGEVGVSSGWFQGDACGKSDSGSISLTSVLAGTSGIYALNGARQCLSAEPAKEYSLTADAEPYATALAGVGLLFFSSEDCSGNPVRQYSYSSRLVQSIGDWQTVAVAGTASNDSRSVAARLIVGAPTPPPNGIANVLFDNILLLER
jgi:hypothetical protein